MEKALRYLNAIPLCLLIVTLSCGSGKHSSTSTSSPLSGNWQLTLVRHANTEQFIFSGFLLQSGNNVSGSLTLSAGCVGVGSVTGTFDGQNLQLTIGGFGQDFSLTATLPSGTSVATSLAGQFSTLQGGCIGFASTGTWSAVRVQPLTGPFHGTVVLGTGITATTIGVSGTMSQGPNIGASNATLSGTLNETSTNLFCSYLGNITLTGLIGGSNANLTLYGYDGSQVGQIVNAIVAPDGTSLTTVGGTGNITVNKLSSGCLSQTGSITITFP
jgi:hypothetical protein